MSRFQTTRWSLIAAARDHPSQARSALEQLCRAYRPPVLAFVCHSGYGIWGTVDAKMAGVRHMLKTATRSYTFPIEHHGPFDIDSCLNCHAQAATFRAVDAHKDPDTQQALFKREMGCTGICHAAAHPDEALNGPAS